MRELNFKVDILCIGGIEFAQSVAKAGPVNRRSSIDLRHLEILRALVETGKTTAAAQRLGTSQSAVSRGIAQLETQLGRVLFDRRGGRLVPRPEAFTIHEQVEPVLAAFARLSGGEAEPRPLAGPLRLAAPPTLAHRFLPARIASFIRQNSEVEINLDILPSDALIINVAEERVDLGLTDAVPAHSGVRSELLLATDAVCVLPARHPLAARSYLEPHDLENETFIALTRRHSGRFAIDHMFERAGVEPRIVIETSTAVSAGEFVREGLGVALLNPFPMAGQFGPAVVVRPFRPRIGCRTSFLMTSRAPISAVAAAFMAHTRASLDGKF
jgi:DNA-binding transcriptional LysR family regulator